MVSRSVAEWNTNNYEAAVDLANRMTEYVEANEPDTLVFEWFGNEDTRKVVWYQVYRDDEAFLNHAQNMIAAGFRAEAEELFNGLRVLLLTRLTHPQTKEMARQIGAEQVVPIAGVVRQ